LPALLTDLMDCDVTMIAAFGNSAARAAKIARTTLPVVFASSSDPVAIGLVTSLNRPGANMTGVSILNQELESTRLERLIEAVPQPSTIGFLVNPDKSDDDAEIAGDGERGALVWPPLACTECSQ
jgi:putative ABC transport system substrate-binding protein